MSVAWANYRDPDPHLGFRLGREGGLLESELLKCEEKAVSAQLKALRSLQDQRGTPSDQGVNFTTWWSGHNPKPARHQKTMHLADRLLRSFPGILMSESAHAMAVYRRVSLQYVYE